MIKGDLQAWLTDLRFALRAILGQKPWLYFALQRLRPRRRTLLVTKNTEIVIEGYPRSANTFAVAAFLLAQDRPVKIARHLHVPAQVIKAVKIKIPTLVLIRKPEDAALSLMVREPRMSAKRALYDYINFYRTIQPYCADFVLATFEEVTTNFGYVIERVNSKFGTTFIPFEHTESNIKKVFYLVEQMDKEDQRSNQVTETTVARPSEVRKALKLQRHSELNDPKLSQLLKEALSVYQVFIQCSKEDCR